MRVVYYAVAAANVRLDDGPIFFYLTLFFYVISNNARPHKNATVAR